MSLVALIVVLLLVGLVLWVVQSLPFIDANIKRVIYVVVVVAVVLWLLSAFGLLTGLSTMRVR